MDFPKEFISCIYDKESSYSSANEIYVLRFANSESKNKEQKHILSIHGIGVSLVGWRDIPDALSEHFHTISVDLIGFGGSEKPTTADYSIKGFSGIIFDFLQAIDVKDEKICIVGHSLGGYIALQFAFENKDLVEKLVLVDTSGKLDGSTPLLVYIVMLQISLFQY